MRAKTVTRSAIRPPRRSFSPARPTKRNSACLISSLSLKKLPEGTRDGDAFLNGRQEFERQTGNAVELAHDTLPDDRHFGSHLFGIGALQIERRLDPLLFEPGRPLAANTPNITNIDTREMFVMVRRV